MTTSSSSIWSNSRIVFWIRRFLPYRWPFLVVFQLTLLTVSYTAAYYLRFEGLIPRADYLTMIRTLPIVLTVQVLVFHYHDLFRGLWRYVSFADLQNILRATIISVLALLVLEFLFGPYTGYIPRSIYALDFLLVVVLTGGCRFIVRHLRERYFTPGENVRSPRVMLVGPVKAAEPLLREMHGQGNVYLPVVVVEPEEQYGGYRVCDVPIVGGLGQIGNLIKRYQVQEVIFTWPDAPRDKLNDIIEESKRFRVRCKIVPSLTEVLGGRYRLADVRDIELEDLLPRPPIYIEREHISNIIDNRVILVTGGSGSIGSELCRQIAQFNPRTLVILERAENTLYETEVTLRRRFPDLNLQALVASINDARGLNILLSQYRPALIFHAAAYKHVPLMERCPIEAAYNNILGTRNLVKAALASGAEHFVMISTDKAVNPTSVMGVSKRIAEKYVQAANCHHRTQFITTRFGNVLGSAGSVIPIFKEQLAQGGPLTVTDPGIERYFMTIPEAVQLVLQAAYMGRSGDTFCLNMGCLVNIRDLAEKLIVLAGKTPGEDVAITYTGLRPGEKLYEELFNDDEQSQPTDHPMISYAVGRPESQPDWEAHLDDIQSLVDKRNVSGLLAKFQAIIPNYKPFHQMSRNDHETLEPN